MAITRSSTGLVFRDTFNRADGAPGANYTIQSGGWAISGNKLAITSPSSGGASIAVNAFANRKDYHVQILSTRQLLTNYAIVVVRQVSASPETEYFGDLGSTTDGAVPGQPRLHRATNGAFTRIGAGAFASTPNVAARINLSAIGTDIRLWANGVQQVAVVDATAANDGIGKMLLSVQGQGGAGLIQFDDLIVCSDRTVTIADLPAGHKIRAAGIVSAAEVGGSASIDLLGTSLPAAQIDVLDASDAVVESFAPADGVWGGDAYEYSDAPVEPPEAVVPATSPRTERSLSPALNRCLDRANPNVATFVEISIPDNSKVLRRAEDQFLTDTPDGPRVSETPANSTVASPAGALTLADTDDEIVNQYVNDSAFGIPRNDPAHYVNTVGWRLEQGFPGAVLRKVTARLRWTQTALVNGGLGPRPNVTLNIFRAHQIAGQFSRQDGSSVITSEGVRTAFVSLLSQVVQVSYASLNDGSDAAPSGDGVIGVDGYADVVFDLTDFHVVIDALSSPPPGPGETGTLPEIYFEIQTDQTTKGTLVEWRRDETSAQVIAGVGKVREVAWRHDDANPEGVWTSAEESGATLDIKLDVAQYEATAQVVYTLDLPALPSAASEGRIVFRKGEPEGTSATMELSTTGSGGPWTEVQNGQQVSDVQLEYHARITLDASADQRRAPVVAALGVEFRRPVDVSPESVVEHMSQDVSLPFCQASVGEGRITVVRTGRRDYRDVATEIAVAGPDTKLEADIFLGSRHPQVSRADWFHLSRAPVSTRNPSGPAESFPLLSRLKQLKKKIPARIESINQVVTVTAATTTQITVDKDLVGTSDDPGNEYDGQGYYVRVRSSDAAGIETGSLWTIAGNTGKRQLDFDFLGGTLEAGDQIEVHSGAFQQPALTWIDQDPADVWMEILTLHLLVPSDQIGFAGVGNKQRAGLPPKVTDRAPGDAALQAKCKVTLKVKDAQDASELLDQLSFIMGGTTIEIGGQIVFRQIYPLVDASGNVTVAPDGVAAVFDPRDYADLSTPTGREQRISELSCDYGVDSTTSDNSPVSTTVNADVDALAALGTQDVEGLGTAVVPDEIARWLFNSADAGLQLATFCGRQVILACSTGLRQWAWTSVTPKPDVIVGDTVYVVTDQYTDYDPARQRQIRGWNAYPLTVVGTSGGGRRFRGFLQGLAGVYGVSNRGGLGTLQDINPPLTSDTDTVTPVLTVIPSAPTDTTQRFDISASNPKVGGPAPTLAVTLEGCTATIDGVAKAVGTTTALNPAGSIVIVDRQPFDTETQAAITINAAIAGGGSTVVQRTILNQVKVVFGPSLEVETIATSDTDWTFGWTFTGTTLTLTVNGVATAVPGTNPYTATRPAADANADEYRFTGAADGQIVQAVVLVLPQKPPVISTVIGLAEFSPDTLTVTWNESNMPVGATFNVSYTIDGGTGGSASNVTSGHVFNVSWPGSTPSGTITVEAVSGGVIIATRSTPDMQFPQ